MKVIDSGAPLHMLGISSLTQKDKERLGWEHKPQVVKSSRQRVLYLLLREVGESFRYCGCSCERGLLSAALTR